MYYNFTNSVLPLHAPGDQYTLWCDHVVNVSDQRSTLSD